MFEPSSCSVPQARLVLRCVIGYGGMCWMPRHVLRLEALPKTALGKVQKAVLQKNLKEIGLEAF